MKCALVIPYFGKFPNYFKMWLVSAAYTGMDFLIFTDAITEEYSFPDNVYVTKITFSELKSRIKQIMQDKKIVLHDAYKLCDYRISYGKIFENELEGYDYWGYCDVDLIWGNPFCNMDLQIIRNAQKLFTRGHFCLFKNDEYSRNLYKRTDLDSFFKYPYAYRTKYECHYDELYEWNDLIRKDGKNVYDVEEYADIDYRHFRFRLAERNDFVALGRQVYVWEQGHLFRYYLLDGKIKVDEVNYIHLQKRSMNIDYGIDYSKPILIAPNVIKNVEKHEIDARFVEKYSVDKKIWKEYVIRKIKWDIKKIRNGGIPYKFHLAMFRVKRKMNKI